MQCWCYVGKGDDNSNATNGGGGRYAFGAQNISLIYPNSRFGADGGGGGYANDGSTTDGGKGGSGIVILQFTTN